jgi:hypothetical protein
MRTASTVELMMSAKHRASTRQLNLVGRTEG